MTNYSDRIREILFKEGLTIKDFCKKIGLKSPNTIQLILKENRTPSPKTMKRILDAFPNIDPNWLIYGNTKKTEQEELTKSAKQVIDFIIKDLPEKIAIVLEDMKQPLEKIERIEKDLEAMRVYMAAKFEVEHKEKIE